MTSAERRHPRHPPPLRAVLPRPLRRQPRRRRLQPRAVRRRRDRAVHPHRRRRGAVRVVLRRPVPGTRCGPATCSRSAARSTRVGTRSRDLDFAVHVVARGAATAERARRGRGARRADRWPPPRPAPSSSPADRTGRHPSRRVHATRRPEAEDFPCRSGARERTAADLRICAFPQVTAGVDSDPRHDRKYPPGPLVQIVASGPASEWLCRRMGRHHPQDTVRGGRSSLREGGHGRASRPLDNFSVLGSQSVSGWSEGPGALPSLCSRRCPGTFASVLLRTVCRRSSAGVVLALAFEPVGAVLPACPFARGRPSSWSPAACPCAGPGCPGLAFGIGFCYVLMFWMRVVGYDAWAGARRRSRRSFYGLLGLGRRPCCCRCRAWPRAGSPSPGWRWRRSGPAGRSAGCPGAGCLRHRGHAVAEGPAVRRRRRRQPPAGPARRRCWPGSCSRAGRARLVPVAAARRSLAVVAGCPALAPYSPDDRRPDATVAAVQGNVPGDGDDILLDHRQVTQQPRRRHRRGSPTRSRPASSRSPTSCSGRRTPPPSTRSSDAEINADIEQAVAGDRRPDPGRRDGRRRARARAQPGHRLGPGHRGEGTGTPSGTRCRSASTSRGAASSAATSAGWR